MKVNTYQLFDDFCNMVNRYRDDWTIFYAHSTHRQCMDVLDECLGDALHFYDDELDNFPRSYIVELAMHYACNRGVFDVGSRAWYDYWNADLEGYYMPLSHKLKHDE